jgi:ubiquinone/menaquinone biosynthesis C-methylase UbiE
MATMHGTHNDHKGQNGPETIGAVIHWTSPHDILVRLLGLGVNGANSRMIVEMAKIKPGDKILDAGCGTGDLTLTAENYVGTSGSAYGIDASPEGIDLARKKAKRCDSDAVFEVGFIEKIPYPDATFDVVISRLVIHHLPDDLKRRGIMEIFRVLKPGGLVFLADFKPPTKPVLAHLASALIGHRIMMQSNLEGILPMLMEMGFVEVASGPTRSALLAFVSGKKPTA